MDKLTAARLVAAFASISILIVAVVVQEEKAGWVVALGYCVAWLLSIVEKGARNG